MSWFYYALFFAITTSITNILYKKLANKMHYLSMALASFVFNLPFLLIIILCFYGMPRVDYLFWLGILGTGSLNILASVLSFKSFKMSDISLLAPIAAINPVFITIISSFTLKEIPSIFGFVGILLVAVGGYFLNIKHVKNGFFAPFKKLFSDKGAQYMMICYLIWSITPTFEKIAIKHTFPQNPPFISLAAGMIILSGLTLLAFFKGQKPIYEMKKNWKVLILIGLLGVFAEIAIFTAFALNLLGYAAAISKTSIFFTIVLAHFFLKEKNIKEKLLGSIIMFLGVLMLIL